MKINSGIIVALLIAFSTAANAADVQVLGGRPKGCPSRWCMCYVSLELFGRIIPRLNLAANWPRDFNRAEPAPGMVAARSGHGFILERLVNGSVWVVKDGNTSGRKGHRIAARHQRSIRGYAIVDPHSPKRRLARGELFEHLQGDVLPQSPHL